MSLCDLATDFVLSAIKYSNFSLAKKLCEIYFFQDRIKFTYLYGIINLALDNKIIIKNIILKSNFLEFLTVELRNHSQFFSELLQLDSSIWEFKFDKCTQLLKREIINSSSKLRKILAGNNKKSLFFI